MSVVGLPTLLQLAKLDAGNKFPLIEEAMRRAPELSTLPGRTISGSTMELTVRNTLPTVSFRNANEGSVRSFGDFETRVFQTHILDQQIAVDKRALEGNEDQSRVLDAAQIGHLEAAFRLVSSQTYYGTTNDAKGFPGLIAQYDSTNMEEDATGSTAKTSVWMIAAGANGLQFIFGAGSGVTLSPWTDETIYDASGNGFSGMQSWIYGRIGLSLENRNAALRIKNIGTDSNKGLTDALLYKALEKFTTRYQLEPTHILMNGRSQEQLRASRSNTGSNVKGEVPPLPDDWYGIPIVRTFGILNSES
jgi:hypothetical protein